MRAVNFVKRLQWDLPGTVCRHGLAIGDVDNDGDNELVVGTAEGVIYIFKGSELWQRIPGVGHVTAVAIGDIFNYGRNALVVISGDGWAHIYYSPRSVNPSVNVATTLPSSKDLPDQDNARSGVDQSDGSSAVKSGKMERVHVQRIPTNSNVVLVADVDKDGANEMILGLTDRVVGSYRWSSNLRLGRGELVALNKWECANQIGTITIQHAADGTPTILVAQPGGTFMRIKCGPEGFHVVGEDPKTGKDAAESCVDYQTLGISRMRNPNISTEIIGDLEPAKTETTYYECKELLKPNVSSEKKKESEVGKKSSDGAGDKKSSTPGTTKKDSTPGTSKKDSSSGTSKKDSSSGTSKKYSTPGTSKKDSSSGTSKKDSSESSDISGRDQVDGNILGGNVIQGDYDDVKSEKDSLLPTYKDFSFQDNNCSSNNNNTDLIGKSKTEASAQKEEKSQTKPYALATLDGTIMLVRDEVILWSMQVDHHIFALCRLDVTGDGADEIVVCAWDGQTYILDQKRNSVRFQFEESVRAFCTGNYNVTPGISTPCLVYNTFHNKIFLYYDVTIPSMVIKTFNPFEILDLKDREMLEKIIGECSEAEKQQRLKQFTEWLLYQGD